MAVLRHVMLHLTAKALTIASWDIPLDFIRYKTL